MRHEACGAQEVFVGNTSEGVDRLSWLKSRGVSTARLGHVALDIDGKPLPETYRPIFINRAEIDLHDRVMYAAAAAS